MTDSEDRPSRCNACGTPLAGKATVDISVRREDRARTTVLCEDCATVSCVGCGHPVPITSALTKRTDIWDTFDLFECVKCGESVPAREIVELRHKENASYRKLVCADCLKDIPIPSNIRVVRDVA